MAEGDVQLQVKKYTFLGASVSDELTITDSLLEIVKKISDKEEEEDSAVKWLRVERLKKSRKNTIVLEKLHEQPEDVHVQMKENSDTDYSFQYIIDAEGLMKEVDPKLHASALATGLGAYFIAFPLDSFAEDVPEPSKSDLVQEICDSVSVIEESASHPSKVLDNYNSKPQVILLGTHRGVVDPTEVKHRQKVASNLLSDKSVDNAKCNIICAPESDVVWAIDVDSSLEEMWEVLDEEVDEIEVPVRHSWIEAYMSFDDKKKAKRLSKPVPKQDYQQEIKKILDTELSNEEFEKLLDVFHLLGRLVIHKDHVFSQTYLCEIFQNLAKKRGRLRNCSKAIGMMLVDKGLAVAVGHDEFIVPAVFKKYNANPPESAAPFYLAIVKGFRDITPISIAIFWRMIMAVQAKESWDCDTPNYCNYIWLQYQTYSVHVSLVGKVIKVAVEKRVNKACPKASNMKNFAETCQEIQKSLLKALKEIVGVNKGINVKWGFTCEGDHCTEDSSSQCISITKINTVNPDDYHFECPLDRHRQPRLTLRHEVWFLTEIPEAHELVEDKGIWTVPKSVNQPANDPPSSNAPFDPENFNHPPSDDGLLGVVERLGADWYDLAISLGVPHVHVKDCKGNSDRVEALTYWRDGKSGKGYDTTWTFLLGRVSEKIGSVVADDLEKKAMKNYPSWWKN